MTFKEILKIFSIKEWQKAARTIEEIPEPDDIEEYYEKSFERNCSYYTKEPAQSDSNR